MQSGLHFARIIEGKRDGGRDGGLIKCGGAEEVMAKRAKERGAEDYPVF